MTEVLTLPPNLPNAQNAEVGASKFCPGCGQSIKIKHIEAAAGYLMLG